MKIIISYFSIVILSSLKSWTNGNRLVVLHDESLNFGYSSYFQTNVLMEEVVRSVASSMNLTLEFYKIYKKSAFFSVDWQLPDVKAVLAFGDCFTNKRIFNLGRLIGSPITLSVNLEPCVRKKFNLLNSIPLHFSYNIRRYNCLIPELVSWIKYPVPNHYFYKGINVTQRNYYQSYSECLGDDNLEVLLKPSIMDSQQNPSIPYSLQLERGKKYLNGRQMVIATINRPPFVNLQMDGDTITGASGFCLTMLDSLAIKFNFTYKLVLTYDGNWGGPMANGTFNGMIGMVNRREVDFAMAGFTITQIRDTVIDFTHAFYEEPTTILIPAPKEQQNILAFLDPYTWEVWSCILMAVLTIGPFVWFFSSYCDFLPLLYPNANEEKRQSMISYLWACAFCLTAQSNKMRQTTISRILMGTWWLANVILIYTYTSTLIAFLTVPQMQSLINSLEELGNQRNILWTYIANTAHEALFGNAPSPGTYHKIGQLIREQPHLLVAKNEDGINAVIERNMAFIKEKSYLDFVMEQDYKVTKRCRLSQVPQLFFSSGFGWALEEESIYLHIFNDEILRMMQTGLFTIWRKNFWPKPNECTAGGGNVAAAPRALQIKNFYGHFLILGIGFLCSSVVLIIEKNYRRITKFIFQWNCLRSILGESFLGKQSINHVKKWTISKLMEIKGNIARYIVGSRSKNKLRKNTQTQVIKWNK